MAQQINRMAIVFQQHFAAMSRKTRLRPTTEKVKNELSSTLFIRSSSGIRGDPWRR